MTLKRIDYTYRGKPSHKYELDGIEVPGVTTILSKAIPKPALVGWGIKSVAEYAADNLDTLVAMEPLGRDAMLKVLKASPYAERDAKAQRGTDVHALAEQLIKGEAVEVPPHLSAHVHNYVRFLDEWKVKPVLTEVTVGSRRWKYAGSLDLIADLPDGRRIIADLKTSKGIYPETAWQVAAYKWAEFYIDADGNEQSMADLNITHGYAIHVTDKHYAVHPLDISEDTFRTFQHAAFLASRIASASLLVGGPEVAA